MARRRHGKGKHRLPAHGGQVKERTIEMVDHKGIAHFLTMADSEIGIREGQGRYHTMCCLTEIVSAGLTARRARWCPLVIPAQRTAG